MIQNRSKYNVSKNTNKRTYNGIVFDSEMEMKYYRDVILPKYKSGEIIEYKRQVPYELVPKFKKSNETVRAVVYRADFLVKYNNESEVVIDVKGMADSVAKLKRKLFYYKYPNVNYIWITYVKKYGGWILYDELQKLRRKEKSQKVTERI